MQAIKTLGFCAIMLCPVFGRQDSILQQIRQAGTKYSAIKESLDQFEDLLTTLYQNIFQEIDKGGRRIGGVKDCSDPLYKSLPSSVSVIWPDGQSSMTVYCDQTTDGGGWTVFQRRQDGSVNFSRNYAEYQDGFGDPAGEFWLGLRSLHRLTDSGRYELRVDMAMWNGTKAVATYSNFNVDGSCNKYQLHLGPYMGGNAGDSLSYHNGMFFTTSDTDNDMKDVNCANLFHSGFWHRSCHKANPNGLYHEGGSSPYGVGINWHSLAGYNYSLSFIEMKLRPRL